MYELFFQNNKQEDDEGTVDGMVKDPLANPAVNPPSRPRTSKRVRISSHKSHYHYSSSKDLHIDELPHLNSFTQEPEKLYSPLPSDTASKLVAVGLSTLPMAGRGIFAKKTILKGTLIGFFTGIVHTDLTPFHELSNYAIELRSGQYIETCPKGQDLPYCLCALINDPIDYRLYNCKFQYPHKRKKNDGCELESETNNYIEVISTHTIPKNAELFLPYGLDYWTKRVQPAYLQDRARQMYDAIDASTLPDLPISTTSMTPLRKTGSSIVTQTRKRRSPPSSSSWTSPSAQEGWVHPLSLSSTKPTSTKRGGARGYAS